MILRIRTAGYSLVEALITLIIMAIIMMLVAPSIQNMIRSSKLEAVTRQTSQFVQLARLEAVKRSVPAIVQVDGDSGEIIAFADVDGVNDGDPPDGVFNPVSGVPPGQTDYLLGRGSMPTGISLSAPTSQNAIDGLTLVGADRVVRILPDGSADAVGAYRFGDQRGNFLEVRVEPRATARVAVRKWDEDSGEWWSRGEGSRAWQWK